MRIVSFTADLFLCKAIKKMLKHHSSNEVETVLIQNCQFDDEMLSIIFEGMMWPKKLKTIIVRGGEFGNMSLLAM